MKNIRLIVYSVFALLAFSLVASNSFAVSDSFEKVSPYVFEQLDASDSGSVVVDVYLRDGFSQRKFDKIVEKANGDVLKTYYPEAFTVELDGPSIVELASKGYVDGIHSSFKVKPSLDDVKVIIDAEDVWEKEVDGVKLTGEGQTICVVDTGVDFSHSDLADHSVFGQCNRDCTGSVDCPLDCETGDVLGHGTWVAGMVAASGGIDGVAKGANLIGMRVFEDGRNEADLVDIKRAINWCVSNADTYDISVVSISLGTDENFETFCDSVYPPIATAIDNAVADNIAVVASAGNDGDIGAIELPSCMRNAIPASGTNKDDSVWQGSNYNGMVKLFAPAEDITSTKKEGGYESGFGTSASAPIISGAIAIMNQYLDSVGEQNARHPKTDLEETLFVNGEEVSGLSKDTWTRININNAILSLDAIDPVVELVSPRNREQIRADELPTDVEFVCRGSDWQLDGVTFKVVDVGRGDIIEENRDISGDISEEQFIASLGVGVYRWNCEFRDENGNSAWADNDHFVYVGPPFLSTARPQP